MLVIDCPVHRRRVLVPPTRIRSLSNTAAGIVVVAQCWCGALVRWRTGRTAVTGGDPPATAPAGLVSAVPAGTRGSQGSNL